MGCAEQNDPAPKAVEKLIEELRQLNIDLEVPSPKDYGIGDNKYFSLLETMAEQALASGSPANNPRIPTIPEMIDIYERIYT
jgi:alcohol dehydrogenase class IV